MTRIIKCNQHENCWNLQHNNKTIIEHETLQVVNNVEHCLNNNRWENSEAQEIAEVLNV